VNFSSSDFTLTTYKKLLNSLQMQDFTFKTFAQYIETNNQKPNAKTQKVIILRHDVDARPQNSLTFACIQAKIGFAGTYYFRMAPQSYNENIINEIIKFGHEVGYHYETMDTCKGNVDKAYDEFCRNLEKLNKLTEIKTISMHGSPMSPYDNREIWKKYDYKQLGIIAEPYFDLNFNQIYYITDTARRWDGHLYNIRDKATKENLVTNTDFLNRRYKSTQDIINNVNLGVFPPQAMLNFHPQRWNDKPLPWLKEIIWQNIKNQGKRILLRYR